MTSKQEAVIRKIQNKYPTCSIGGSVGLMLQGFTFNRNIDKSDLDFCSSEEIEYTRPFINPNAHCNEGSETNDFRAIYEIDGIKCELRTDHKVPIVHISGIAVTRKDYILKFKRWYSEKQSFSGRKHENDIKFFMQMGYINNESKPVDDLPF